MSAISQEPSILYCVFKFLLFYVFYYMHVCPSHVCLVPKGVGRCGIPLELQLYTVLSYHIGAMDQTPVAQKSSQDQVAHYPRLADPRAPRSFYLHLSSCRIINVHCPFWLFTWVLVISETQPLMHFPPTCNSLNAFPSYLQFLNSSDCQ